MLKARVSDIKFVTVRSVAYLLSLLALAGLYYAVAYFISAKILSGQMSGEFQGSPVHLLVALLLIFLFQPIWRFFDRVTDTIFFRDRYDTSDFLIRLGRILTNNTALEDKLKDAGDEIRKTLKASGSLFVIMNSDGTAERIGQGIDDDFTKEDLRILAEQTETNLLMTGGLKHSLSSEKKAIYRLLSKKRVALLLPLTNTDNTIGYLMLGEHLAGAYRQQDIHTVEAMANELVISIQNAQALQTVQDLNTQLERRVKEATGELVDSNEKLRRLDAAKDEFVSMASHQLRTPLTSVKGYISMVLEGDAGKITPMQKQLLSEAFISSERMVHLIGDFLNVSRLQTGKFVLDKNLVNLADLVEEEVNGLKTTAKSRSLKLEYRKPKLLPSLYIDADKINQVIMNFIDNAIYYSPEDTVISIKLSVEEGFVVLVVNDNGIGVPKSEQAELFTKFFRATNAKRQRPDGTGIGLYLAKKIIDAHDGAIIFTSIEGKGSTFGFRLPIKKLSEKPSEDGV